MAIFRCTVCGYEYDEQLEGTSWVDLPDDWECPVCGVDTSYFEAQDEEPEHSQPPGVEPPCGDGDHDTDSYLGQWRRTTDELEGHLALIQEMARTGEPLVEAMRTHLRVVGWDQILIKGAQLASLPLHADEAVSTRTVIGPKAEQPLVLDTPVYVSHMSFGALSREVKIALAHGSAAAGTATCSGEGGILEEERAAAHRYIFEYVPNRYSVSEENLQSADAIEIKIGQSAKPGIGGHLPGTKVTDEIAAVRGFPAGRDIVSPARFADITSPEELHNKVAWLRETSRGRPIGIKLAAGHIEADLKVALAANPDFITIDGRGGATGAAPKLVKDSTSIPTIYALARAARFLRASDRTGVSLVITGGLRVASDFAKALAMGADAVAIATAALIACGCQQYRICHTGRCPVGITTQDPELRRRFDTHTSARLLAGFLRASTRELEDFARLTGHNDVHRLGLADLCTTSNEIAEHTGIEHAGRAPK